MFIFILLIRLIYIQLQRCLLIINELARLGYENANGTMVINEVSSDSDLAGKDINEYDMIIAVNGETMTSTDDKLIVAISNPPIISIYIMLETAVWHRKSTPFAFTNRVLEV